MSEKAKTDDQRMMNEVTGSEIQVTDVSENNCQWVESPKKVLCMSSPSPQAGTRWFRTSQVPEPSRHDRHLFRI